MTSGDRPTFTVVVGTTADDRRLIPISMIRALTGLAESDIGDEALNLKIDAVLASCARSCRLAKAGSAPPTLARETVRAAWPDTTVYDYRWHLMWLPSGRGHKLILPWRAPITSVAIAEGDTDLVEGSDFRYLGAGVIERMNSGTYCGWPLGAIDVTYTAGFIKTPADPSYDESEGDPLPADVVALIADQVRLSISQGKVDPILRSEDIPGVWSGTFNTPGGDAIDTSGLSRPLYDALSDYRAPPSFA